MALPLDIRNLEFYDNAAVVANCRGNNAKSTLLKSTHVIHKSQTAALAEDNILISIKALHDIFSASKIKKVLRCECDICRDGTKATPSEMDGATASAIASHDGQLKLFVTLSLMGGTFAMRELYKDSLHTALEKKQYPEDLRTKLFTRFSTHNSLQEQPHPLKYLESVFQSSLRSKAWILEVPTFRMNDDTRQFREPQNFPFVQEQRLHHRAALDDRAFFSFRIHDDFCESDLRGQNLFRKQLSLAGHQHDARERSENEKNILEFLKDLRHPNIAEILFAYETYAHQYNLVFRFYPCDLDKILYNHSDASRLNITAQGGTPQQFLGSVLDHWLWKGLLGVVDAIANLHDPQNQHVPTPLNGRVVGGHFDIKPANFLIDYDCTLKLTDFGQAYLKSLAAGEEANMTAVPGTYNYSPPPRGSSRKLTIAYDIWSLACVLIEVINFILEEDDDATAKFFRERQNEDREHFAKFWRMNDEIIQSSTRPEPVLKSCVTERLRKWKTLDDQYLTRVIRQIERMLPTSGTSSETAKACLQVFSASVTLDRYMFKSNADTLLGGPKTSKPFQRMRTTFTTEQVVNPLEFDLYVWRNRSKDEITILMEYQSNDGYKFLVPNSTKNTLEQFTPVTARTNPLLQFCFQNLHKAVRFYVPSRKDLYHLQGALTYQLPVEGSEIKFENCTFTTKGFKGKPSVQGAGHIQVWKELTESKHQERYEDESYASDRSSSDSGRAKGARQLTDVLRLALYVYASDSRPALILVMTLTENTNNLYFENTNGEAMMFIERSRYHDFFPLAILEADRDENNSPGIPFSPDILTKKIAAGKQIKELVVSFCNGQDQQKFRAFYDLCFSNS